MAILPEIEAANFLVVVPSEFRTREAEGVAEFVCFEPLLCGLRFIGFNPYGFFSENGA